MSDVTFGVKVPEELKKQLEELMKDSGVRTGKDFLQSLVNCYVVEKTKEQLPEVAQDLKELQGLTQRINSIYLNLGYRIENITKAQQEETFKEISKKNSIISDLQEKLEIAEHDKDNIIKAFNDIVTQKDELNQRVNELTDSNNNIKLLIEEYKGKNDMLLGQMKQYEKYPEQLEATKQLLASQQADSMTKDNLIISLNADIANKDKALKGAEVSYEIKTEELIQRNEENLQLLKSKHDDSVNSLKDKLGIEKDKAILTKDKEHQVELEVIKDKHNKEIENLTREIKEYQAKYKELLERLENKEAPKTNKGNGVK